MRVGRYLANASLLLALSIHIERSYSIIYFSCQSMEEQIAAGKPVYQAQIVSNSWQ
jgi:hypothetical protein